MAILEGLTGRFQNKPSPDRPSGPVSNTGISTIDDFFNRRLGRRDVLIGVGGFATGAALLAACGGDSSSTDPGETKGSRDGEVLGSGDISKELPLINLEKLPGGVEQVYLEHVKPKRLVLRQGSQMTVEGRFKDEKGVEQMLIVVSDPLRKKPEGSPEAFKGIVPSTGAQEGELSFSSILAATGGNYDQEKGVVSWNGSKKASVATLDQAIVSAEKTKIGALFIDRDLDGTLKENPIVPPPPEIKDAYLVVDQIHTGRVVAKDQDGMIRFSARQSDNRGEWKWEMVDANSLKELAGNIGFDIGTVINGSSFNIPKWKETASREFNLAVVANGLHWNLQERVRGVPNFDLPDRDIAFAREKGMKVRGHALLFPQSEFLPDWLKNGEFSRQELIDIMRSRINSVVTRYKGKVNEWVVVNEQYLPPYRPNDIFYKTIGPEYIDLAFQAAREADPDAKLIYNDTLNHTANGLTTRLTRETSQRLASKGLIDMVGMQMHIDAINPPSKQDLINTMRSYRMPVCITELDVNLKDIPGNPDQRYALQARIYRNIIEAAIESGVCKSVSVWGIGDKYSWIENTRSYKGYSSDADPTPFDDDFNPKVARDEIGEAYKAAA